MQQYATGCANGRNMSHPTTLGIVGQIGVRLNGALRGNLKRQENIIERSRYVTLPR